MIPDGINTMPSMDSVYRPGYVTDAGSQKTAFGETTIAEPTPVVQLQFAYNVNAALISERTNGGTLTVDTNRAKLSTGAAANQSSTFLSRVPIKYGAGQGGLCRFTRVWTAGASDSEQTQGIGDAGDGFFFGFNGTAFGVLRRNGGVPEIRTLTVTTKSTTAEDITITLNGDAASDVTVTDATSGDVTTTANDIASHDFSGVGRGWKSTAVGDTVVFIAYDASSRTSTYSLSGASTAVGTFAQTLAGAAPTDTWVAQTAWNVDNMDGDNDAANPSGMTLDITKGNIYQIRYQWLGYGMITFSMEDSETGQLVDVHKIKYANSSADVTVANPTLPLCASVINTSNTSDIIGYTPSFSGFTEGKILDGSVRLGTSIEYAGVGTTETPVLTIRNNEIHASKLNRVMDQIMFVSISTEGTKPATIRFKTNSTLTAASFAEVSSGVSTMQVDTTATGISGGTEQFAVGMAKVDSEIFDLKETNFALAPGDSLTISVEASSGTVDGVASINWVEHF